MRNMKIGQIIGQSIVVGDGELASIGQELWYSDNKGNCKSFIVGAIRKKKVVDAIDKKVIFQETFLIDADFINTNYNYAGQYEPFLCFVNKQEASKIHVAKGGRVGHGDTVWMYRWSGTTVSLVKKKVCAIYDGKVQCTYFDNYWPRKENPNNLYISREDAILDKPCWASKLDVALFRAGQNQ